jgi:hypothetical protein
MSFTLFPIKSSEEHLYKMYKQSVASFWTPEEIPFAKDTEDWGKLTPEAAFHQAGPGVLRGLGRHRPGEPRQSLSA